jgi:Na+/proline symporter
MIMPAILARTFLPDLIAQHKTADVYVLLVIKLLPAGMVGIIVAAMLSATMATVSSDFSSIAGVLTKDVYQRLFSPAASQQKLVRVGKMITLLVGGISLAIGLYISQGGDQALFHLMVVIASAFIAPSFVPLMGALVSRRLNWQGVVVGYFLGLGMGLSLLALRTWVLPHGYWPWLRANFDGASILINTGVTIAGMYAGTLLFGTTGSQEGKFDLIFNKIEIAPAKGQGSGRKLEQVRVISFSTVAVGVLLGVAGMLAASHAARITDMAIAISMIGLGLYRLGRAKRMAFATHSS